MSKSDYLKADAANSQSQPDTNRSHSCITYFYAIGEDFANEFIKELRLDEGFVKITERGVKVGFNEDDSVNINDMYRKTLRRLLNKTELLSSLRERFDLEYFLIAIPELESESKKPLPILSLDDDIIEFLYLTKTHHDLDVYLY